MKILLIGKTGQVGRELMRALSAIGDVVATDRKQLDLADFQAIRRVTREASEWLRTRIGLWTRVSANEALRRAQAPSCIFEDG